jgi:hypothetical protein
MYCKGNFILAKAELKLELHLDNLVDLIWGAEEGRPPYPSEPLFILDTVYAGKLNLSYVCPTSSLQIVLRKW